MAYIQTYTAHRLHAEIVAGQNEGVDTTIPVAGIAIGDKVVAVCMLSAAYLVGEWRNDDFSAHTGDIHVEAHAQDTTGGFYLIVWEDLT